MISKGHSSSSTDNTDVLFKDLAALYKKSIKLLKHLIPSTINRETIEEQNMKVEQASLIARRQMAGRGVQ